MKHLRTLALVALLPLLSSAALARPPMETNQLVDDSGAPVGTDANPLVTKLGPASAGSVTAPGTTGTQAQAVQGINGGVPVATKLPSVSAAPSATQITINTSGAIILASGRTDEFVQIVNTSTTQGVYVGPIGITPTSGHYLAPGGVFTMDTKVNQGQWVAVTAANTAVISILRF